MKLKIKKPEHILSRTKVNFLRRNGERITVCLKEIDEILEICENKENHQIYMHKIPETGHSREIDIILKSPKKLTPEECTEFNLLIYDPTNINPFAAIFPFLREHYYIVDENWLHMDRHIGPGNSMAGPISRMEAFKTVLCCYEHNKTENKPLVKMAH